MTSKDVRSFSEVDDLLVVVQFGDERCQGFSQELSRVEMGFARCREQVNCLLLMRRLQSLQASMDSTCQALQAWEGKALAHLHKLHQCACNDDVLIVDEIRFDYQGTEQKITDLLKILKTQHHQLLKKQKRSERLYSTIAARRHQLKQVLS